ncbi:hypothetical protein SY28_11850 [Meiothermus taiwanensis]|nr:hypothetical protein SY28_11850 [Meiothermus taiwanensis]KZK16149.1 hypothetical protein A3962_07300 [Meiothermus taiwanensis]
MLASETGWQTRLYLRDRAATFFTFAFPPLVLLFWSRQSGPDVLSATALVAALALAMAAYAGLAMGIASAREVGLLKRLRSTPLPMVVHIAARVAACALLGTLALALTLGLGAFGLGLPLGLANFAGLLPGLVLGFAVLGSWGLVVGSLVRTASAASYLVNATLFPLFLLPVAAQRGMLPEWAAALASLLPIQHLGLLIQAALKGDGIGLYPLLVLLGWAVLGAVIAARRLSRPL